MTRSIRQGARFLFSLLLLCLPTAAMATGSRGYGPIYPIVEQVNADVRLVRLSPERAVEQLRGATATARLNQLILRNPQAFATSRRKWFSRGYTPSREVFIERSVRTAGGNHRDGKSDVQRAQTSGESNSEGEILFWSYDGPGDTWQGTIYLEIYSDNTAAIWDGQIDTASYEYPWNFHELTWSGSGDSGGDYQQVRTPPPPSRPGHFTRNGGIEPAARLQRRFDDTPATGIFRVRSLEGWAVCWRAAVVGGCTSAAVGCWRVKAAWPACWATWCLGAEIGGALSCAMVE